MAKPRRPKGYAATYLFEVYRAADGFRWRLWSRSGRIIAESGEAYTRRTTARRLADKLRGHLAVPVHQAVLVDLSLWH